MRRGAVVWMDRRIAWAECLNVRDLGGLPAAGGTTTWRSIVRADNLNRLTEVGRRCLIDFGVRTVVDLRDPREIAKFPYPFTSEDLAGVAILNAPLISAAEWEAIKDPALANEGYVLTPKLSSANIVAALRLIAEAPNSPIVVHCHEGRERTGMVVALLLELADVSDRDIADDWTLSEPSTMKGSAITAMLEYMRRECGTVASFLTTSGLATDHIDALRLRLRG